MQYNSFQKKLMITGCGRSGTRYITFLLRRLGIDIGHESMKKDGIASWCSAVTPVQTPWGETARNYNFDQVFLQIRHPLKVIPSACSFKDCSWQFISEHISVSMDEPVMLRSAKYWYYWNIEAEKISEWHYKIEDLSNVFDEFCERLGVPTNRLALINTPIDVNTRKYGRIVHLYDELSERLLLNSGLTIRNKLKKSSAVDEIQTLTWDQLKSLDVNIYLKIREKAREYGYDN